jgi:predicted Zn-dependent protease
LRYRVFRKLFAVALFATGILQAQTTPQAVSPARADHAPNIAPSVADAEAAIIKSDWKTAQAKLDLYLSAHPADTRALFDAGYVADAQNRLDDAASLYGRAVEANPNSFEARLSYGLLLARQGKTDDARPQLAAATALDPGDAGPALKARAWRALARIDKAADPAQASSDLLEALKLTPETLDDTLLAAQIAETAGQPDTAEAAYRRVLAGDPKSVAANAGLAHLLMTEKKFADAEPLLRAALAQTPNDPALTVELATALAAQNNGEALPLLQQLHAAHPQDEAIARMLADTLAEAGDAAGSDRLYLALLAAHPDDPDLLVAHGQNLTRQLKYAGAFAVFDKASSLAPDDGDAWSGLAFAASKTGQPAITLHALTMRSKVLPELPSTYFLWATSYDTLRDKPQAIAYYHHFLDAANGKFPDQEWQARQRLIVLERKTGSDR